MTRASRLCATFALLAGRSSTTRPHEAERGETPTRPRPSPSSRISPRFRARRPSPAPRRDFYFTPSGTVPAGSGKLPLNGGQFGTASVGGG